MADANRSSVRYIAEASWGVLPATPTMKAMRMTSEDLLPEVETIISEELRSDRMISDTVQVSFQNSGGVNFEFSAGTLDDWLEAALCSDWSTDVLKNGIERKSFSIERGHLDIDEYFLFTGMMANTFNLTLATGAIAKGNITFMGSAATLGQTTNATGGVTAANTKAVMNCMGNVATLKEGAPLTVLSGVYVQELSFTINNNLRPINEIGSDVLAYVGMGKQDLTGTLNIHFMNDAVFDKFLAATQTAIEFTLSVGGDVYVFLFPNVKFETDNITTPGQDQDVLENVTWRALYDSANAAHIKIDRSVT